MRMEMKADSGDAFAQTVSLADKLRFLCDPEAYGLAKDGVELIETHMSYVFLAGAGAYKLKKPVRYPFLDFSTLAARERNCREELRLNRRLAPDVYVDVIPLVRSGSGLALGGAGKVADWLVEMRRLPRERMLDARIKSRAVSDVEIDAVCGVLAGFYRQATASFLTPEHYVARFLREQALNRDVLTRPGLGLKTERLDALDLLDARLASSRPQLAARAQSGRLVDGHGDLRPEHICLTEPVVIFDCLEFNAELRQVDPFDEVALLGVECAQLGAPQLLRRFTEGLALRLGAAPPWELVWLYAAWRATLRARLSVAHLLEPAPRDPERWAPQANLYLDIAARALAGAF
jgi:aminoglycoside phosphotransferase family enzyme